MAWLPWCLAFGIASVYFLLFQPGHYSFDAAHQWWQARTGEFDALHPLAMTLLWQASAAVLPDPAGFFALQLALIAFGTALIARGLPLPDWARGLAVASLLLWPAFAALLPQVWKDLWQSGLLLIATGALLNHRRRPAPGWRWLALLALALATAMRYNALSAVLPLLAWLGIEQYRAMAGTSRWLRQSLAWACLPAVLLPALLLAALLPTRPAAPAWVFVAYWDLAAVSIDTGRLAADPSLFGPEASPQRLALAFRPDSNTTSFVTDDLPFHRLDSAGRRQLFFAWVQLPLREPRAWARHRLRLAGHLFVGGPARDPGLVLAPGIHPFRDNPPLAINPLGQPLQSWWQRQATAPWFAGGGYLLLALLALWIGLQRRSLPATAIALSGIGLALPLLLVAPAAEFRYLHWLVAAAPLALLLALRTQSHSSRAGSGAGRSAGSSSITSSPG